MPEHIERETALQLLNRNSITKKITLADGVSIYDTIKNMPTADVAEVRHGEWKLYGNDDDIGASYFCSLCGWNIDEGEYLDNWSHFKYCPNCGAKMDGKEVVNK